MPSKRISDNRIVPDRRCKEPRLWTDFRKNNINYDESSHILDLMDVSEKNDNIDDNISDDVVIVSRRCEPFLDIVAINGKEATYCTINDDSTSSKGVIKTDIPVSVERPKSHRKGSSNKKQVQPLIFMVDRVLDMRIVKGSRQFYLKWEGFPDSENSWEPEENIESKHIITEYFEELAMKERFRKEKSERAIIDYKKSSIKMQKSAEIKERHTCIRDNRRGDKENILSLVHEHGKLSTKKIVLEERKEFNSVINSKTVSPSSSKTSKLMIENDIGIVDGGVAKKSGKKRSSGGTVDLVPKKDINSVPVRAKVDSHLSDSEKSDECVEVPIITYHKPDENMTLGGSEVEVVVREGAVEAVVHEGGVEAVVHEGGVEAVVHGGAVVDSGCLVANKVRSSLIGESASESAANKLKLGVATEPEVGSSHRHSVEAHSQHCDDTIQAENKNNSKASLSIANLPQNLPQEIFQVEKILRMRFSNGMRYFFLKWEGFPDSENSWEPEINLECPELIDEFINDQKTLTKAPEAAPHRLSSHSKAPLILESLSGEEWIREPVVRPRGFTKGREPDVILASGIVNEELHFLIKWKNVDMANLVSARRANNECPQTVIRFYEGNLLWRNDNGSITSEPNEKMFVDDENGNLRSLPKEKRKLAPKLEGPKAPAKLGGPFSSTAGIRKLPSGTSRMLSIINDFQTRKRETATSLPPVAVERCAESGAPDFTATRQYDSRDIPSDQSHMPLIVDITPATFQLPPPIASCNFLDDPYGSLADAVQSASSNLQHIVDTESRTKILSSTKYWPSFNSSTTKCITPKSRVRHSSICSGRNSSARKSLMMSNNRNQTVFIQPNFSSQHSTTLSANQASLSNNQIPLLANQISMTANQIPLLANQISMSANQIPLSANQIPLSANQIPLSANQLIQQNQLVLENLRYGAGPAAHSMMSLGQQIIQVPQMADSRSPEGQQSLYQASVDGQQQLVTTLSNVSHNSPMGEHLLTQHAYNSSLNFQGQGCLSNSSTDSPLVLYQGQYVPLQQQYVFDGSMQQQQHSFMLSSGQAYYSTQNLPTAAPTQGVLTSGQSYYSAQNLPAAAPTQGVLTSGQPYYGTQNFSAAASTQGVLTLGQPYYSAQDLSAAASTQGVPTSGQQYYATQNLPAAAPTQGVLTSGQPYYATQNISPAAPTQGVLTMNQLYSMSGHQMPSLVDSQQPDQHPDNPYVNLGSFI